MADRGPSTRHARLRAEERLALRFTPQRQTDILRRLKGGKGRVVRVDRSGAKRWLLDDAGERLLVVADPPLRKIITIWTVEPGSDREAIFLAAASRLEEAALKRQAAKKAARRERKAADKSAGIVPRKRAKAGDACRLIVPPSLVRAKNRLLAPLPSTSIMEGDDCAK